MTDDGIALTSTAHPVAPWYRRIWLWLRGSHLSPDSLETIEIDIEEPQWCAESQASAQSFVDRMGRAYEHTQMRASVSNVTNLSLRPKRPELIWECRCGGQHFYLHNDGTIECRSCKLVNETIEWVFRDGQGPKQP